MKLPSSVAELKCLIPAPRFCECSMVLFPTPLRVRFSVLSSFCSKPVRSVLVNMIYGEDPASHKGITREKSETEANVLFTSAPDTRCAATHLAYLVRPIIIFT